MLAGISQLQTYLQQHLQECSYNSTRDVACTATVPVDQACVMITSLTSSEVDELCDMQETSSAVSLYGTMVRDAGDQSL